MTFTVPADIGNPGNKLFGDRPFTHWPTAVLTALLFAILFEAIYVVAMSLLGDPLAIGLDALAFGLLAFVGYIAVVGLVRRTNNKSNAPRTGSDQP